MLGCETSRKAGFGNRLRNRSRDGSDGGSGRDSQMDTPHDFRRGFCRCVQEDSEEHSPVDLSRGSQMHPKRDSEGDVRRDCRRHLQKDCRRDLREDSYRDSGGDSRDEGRYQGVMSEFSAGLAEGGHQGSGHNGNWIWDTIPIPRRNRVMSRVRAAWDTTRNSGGVSVMSRRRGVI